jgi:hypothetical protein
LDAPGRIFELEIRRALMPAAKSCISANFQQEARLLPIWRRAGIGAQFLRPTPPVARIVQ